jgi:hypothetical protein
MERYVGRRVHPVPHRRIDEAISRLPAPTWRETGNDDLLEVAHAAVVLVVVVALAVAGSGLASVLGVILLASLH